MTDLTALLSPTATSASSPAPAAPTSVAGVPGMAGQFAQTLGELLAGTPSPAPALPLPILGIVGPLPNGKLLATGMTDRQALADDGSTVPAEPAFPLLANPAWRATVVAPATPPRTPVSLRTALERAAAQLATPSLAKAARGANTTPTADAPAGDEDPVSVRSDTPTNDPATPTPDLQASVPAIPSAMLPIPPLPREDTARADAVIDSSGPVVAPLVQHSPGNPPAVAIPVATPAAPTIAILPVAAEPDLAARSIARPVHTLLAVGATPTVRQGAATAIAGPVPATTHAGRPVPSDQAILTALEALPHSGRGGGMVQDTAPVVTATPRPTAPQVAAIVPLPVTPDASPLLTADAPAPGQPRTSATVPAATDALPTATATATATTSAVLAGRTAAITPDSPAHGETVPVRADRSLVPPIAVSNTPQPAGQVFAAALASATTWRDRPAAADRTDPAVAPPPLGFTTAGDIGSMTPVKPTGDAQRTPLDLTQDSGVQRMIDHIEVLRDDADSRDTRIRLVPDALGSVGVAVRQVGERIHVSFTAEHEATRALIADAQPRLTELAAERGVRIAGTSVATDANPGSSQSLAQGQGQSQSQPQPQSQSQSQSRSNAPQQPPRAAARAQRDTDTPEDQRLA